MNTDLKFNADFAPGILRKLLWVTVIYSTFALTVLIPLFASRKWVVAGLQGILLSCAVISLCFLRKGKVKPAGGIFLGGVWLAIATAVFLSRGIGSPLLMGLTLIASISYWLFGRRMALLVSGCVCLSVIILGVLAAFGIRPRLIISQAPINTAVAFLAITALSIVALDLTLAERLRAEQALLTSETRMRLFFERQIVGMAFTSPEKGWLQVNDRLCQMLGYTQQELAGMTWAELTHPDDLAPDVALFNRLLAGEIQEYSLEKRFLRKDGVVVYAEISIGCVRKPDGSVDYLLALVQDITERKRAEIAFRESEERYRRIARCVPDLVWTMDLSGRFTYSNSAVERMHGWTVEEHLQLNFRDTTTPAQAAEHAAMLADEVAKAMEPGYDRNTTRTFESEELRKDGSTFLAEISATFLWSEDGKPVGVVGVTRDISERKRTEAALRQSEAQLRAFVQNAPFGISTASMKQDRILSVNPALVNMMGYDSAAEMMSLRLSRDLYFDPEDRVKFLAQLPEYGEYRGLEFHWKRKDGKPITLRGSGVVRPDPEHPGDKLIEAIEEDVTQARLLEDSLRQAQKMEAVGRLAAGVAHDFNNMLSVILGHAQLGMNRSKTEDPVQTDLKIIEQSALRSADLTRQLLAFARKQTVAPKVLDLNDTVASLLKMLQRLIGEDIDLAWEPGASLWPVKIDPSQIDQILANLCVNARDAIAGVGKITIETQNMVLDAAYCAVHSGMVPGEYVMLAVSDDGCGIDKGMLSHIFEPFFTTKELGRGTGLGLATVYGIVRQNDGLINVYSEPGGGSTFKVLLPKSPVELIAPVAAAAVEMPKAQGETVLLVEDERLVLKMAQSMLEDLGYKVIAAATPGEAVMHAKAHAGKIQLLITDVVMPEMNGRDLAQFLSKINPGLRCLFTSGYTANVIAHRGILDEGVRLLQKPFTMKDLSIAVRQALKEE